MKIHKRYRVVRGADRFDVVDIFVGIPVLSNGRPMVALAYEEALAIADLLNAMEEERLGRSSSVTPPR